MDRLYSIEDAARMLGGVSPLTVMKWYTKGRITRTKAGRRTMIAESELKRFIAESNRDKTEVAALEATMNKRFLRLPTVIDRTGYSRSSIYALMSRGEFPKAYPLGGRAIAWLQSDIDAWIEAKISAIRNKGQAA